VLTRATGTGDREAEILATGAVPGPPRGPVDPALAHPLAVDVDGDLAVILYAVFDAFPEISPGWWCDSTVFRRVDGAWGGGGPGGDNSTSQRPFARPDEVENSIEPWTDWPSNGNLLGWEDGFTAHTCFGIAPTRTARVTIAGADGRERDLRITPWCGAYVAVVRGETSTLTGYGHDGAALGRIERGGAG
jgi:hypothetical protein